MLTYLSRRMWLLAMYLSASLSAQQASTGDQAILARIGTLTVTEQEFLERFELLPGIQRQGSGALQAAKAEFLASLVAEKLLASNAQRYGVDRTESMVQSTDLVRRFLARDELYRDEIQRKVTVSASEISKAVRTARTMRLIAYVHAEERRYLDSIYARTRSASGLAPRAADLGLLCDTITVRWGEAESSLEEVAFSTPIGSVSKPVGSSVGWFVIGSLHELPDAERLALDLPTLRSAVESRLRLRKEERRLGEFLRTSLRGTDGHGRRPSIQRLADALRQALATEEEGKTTSLTEGSYAVAVSALERHLDDTLAVMGERWMSLRDGLTRFYTSAATWHSLHAPALERSLSATIRQWVWQDLLETMALERGLDGRPQIVRQVAMWRDHYLSEEMVRRVSSQTKATDLDVYRTMALSDPSIPLPRLSVRVASAATVAEVAVFVDALSGLPKDAVPVAAPGITLREFQSESVDRLGIVAAAAWPLKVGAWSRVTVVDSLAIAVQLLERFVPELPPGVYDSVASVATSQKLRRSLADLVARLARSERVEMYEDRLQHLNVSSTPMMTYRLLGFGGRMFAVPFVRPQTDWMDRVPPQGTTIP